MDINKTSTAIAQRPTDDYDVTGWQAFYAAHPELKRSVGSAGDDNGEGGEGTSSDGNAGDEAGDANKDKSKNKTAEETLAELEALKEANAALKDEKAQLLKETMSKKEGNKKAKADKEAAEAKVTELQAQLNELFGDEVDLDGLQEKIKEKKAAEEEALKKAGDFDKLKERIVAENQAKIDKINGEHGAKVKELTSELEAANAEIRRLLVSNSFANSQFLNEELTLTPSKAEKLYGDHFKVEKGEDGRMSVRAYEGETPLADDKGNFLSFEDAFKSIIDADPDKNLLMRSKAKDGAGSGTDNKAEGKIDKTQPRGVSAIAAGLNKK